MNQYEALVNENISLKCQLNLKDAQIERLKGQKDLRKISERFLQNFATEEGRQRKCILQKNI